MGLDWDAPAFPNTDAAHPIAPLLPALAVDYGRLRGRSISKAVTPSRTKFRSRNSSPGTQSGLKVRPDDPESLHQRGHAFFKQARFDQALHDFAAASAIRPLDGHLRTWQGLCLFNLKRYALALDQLEPTFRSDPDSVLAILNLADVANNRAWSLATGPEQERKPALAIRLARFAVALAPRDYQNLNTLGVALYRAGQSAEATAALEKSLNASRGEYDGCDLFFLAMAHQRLGGVAEARSYYDRAVLWLGDQEGLAETQAKELAEFRAEAEAVLAGPAANLPAEVFAPSTSRSLP